MDTSKIQEAAKTLWDLWLSGSVISSLPEAMRPLSRADGYAIQSQLEERTASTLYGWKIAATSTAGQQHIRVDGPLAGRILQEQVRDPASTVSLKNNRMSVAECEFAFKMGRSLSPRTKPYSQAEVMDCVASLHPAIEIPDSRFDAFETVGAAQLIADDACAHLFALGAAATCNWQVLDLSRHAVTAMVYRGGNDGVKVTSCASQTIGQRQAAPEAHHGVGANVLGDPRIALTWLANELSSLGLILAEGMVVTTGTCITPIPVKAGDRVIASFGVIGEIEMRFSA
jgi:2-keto-4-pentenoate hydratase